MARKFFYVCAGMLMLALSFHLGANTAAAQLGNGASGVMFMGNGGVTVMTTSGDTYWREVDGNRKYFGPLANLGNFWSGAPTPALHESWGQVKARYRSTPGMTVTPGSDNK